MTPTPERREINGCPVVATVEGAYIVDHPAAFMVYRGFRLGTRQTMKGAISLAERTAPVHEAGDRG